MVCIWKFRDNIVIKIKGKNPICKELYIQEQALNGTINALKCVIWTTSHIRKLETLVDVELLETRGNWWCFHFILLSQALIIKICLLLHFYKYALYHKSTGQLTSSNLYFWSESFGRFWTSNNNNLSLSIFTQNAYPHMKYIYANTTKLILVALRGSLTVLSLYPALFHKGNLLS